MAQSSAIPSWSRLLGLGFCFFSSLPAHAQGDASGEKIYRQTLRSTVWIIASRGGGLVASGTGALVDSKKRLVITNYHVVLDSEKVIVVFPAYRKGKLITERAHYLDLVRN